MADKFIHIHLHTEYSLLDGLSKITKLVKKTKELEMSAVATTDHGVMYGSVEFFKAAKKEGVKPIIGMEAYTTNIDHTLRPERGNFQNNHLLLLAKDQEGYKNLMKITSIAHVEGYYYRPRIYRELLAKYSKGLICTSACPAGELAGHLIDNNMEEARKTVKWFQDVFGEDYYLEVQRHEYDKFLNGNQAPEIRAELQKMTGVEKTINEGVVALSKEFAIPIVATNDAHYINKEDAEAQDVLVCVATGKLVTDTKRIRFIDAPNYYMKSTEEMQELFPDLPEALTNTVKLAEKCNVEIEMGKWSFPKYSLPENTTPEEELTRLTHLMVKEKYPTVTEELTHRMEHELGIINQKGYAPYFLIVKDMVQWANERGIITNTRGSAAGSLVSFVLGITTVDPIKYYLPFERFLNPYRPTPPDIDFDVSDDRREDILNYMADTYGREKVAQICTFGRMLARASVRDIARVLGYPYAVGDKISKLIPPPKQGFPIDVQKALDTTPDLKKLYDEDADAKKILDLAHQVEGSARHISVHAAGVVVAPEELTNFSPIQKEPSGDKIITQYEMHACEDIGLIKFDILGIRNLSILGSAVKIVKETRGETINLQKIPIDDKKTYEMLARGETMGVFQFGSGGMTKYLKDLKPERVEDLMAMVALYRPGPMAVIPEYIERKKDPRKVKFLDPRMEKFLKASYGLLVYQDDLLFCVLDLAGYTWEEADKFRKAVGKKIPEEMAAQKEKFISGITSNGQTQAFAEDLWKLFEPFQSYGFNKAHAASYGMVAYQTAYMKANYPVEYMCALLTAEAGDTEKITEAISECKRMGIEILPPSINESSVGFTISKSDTSLNSQAIRFGLSGVKNVGEAAIHAILESRSEGKFVSFGNFLTRVDGRKVNKKVLESLIKVGAMSDYGTRAALLASMDAIREKVKPQADTNQMGLFDQDDDEPNEEEKIQEVLVNIPEFSEKELENMERELLGFSLTAKPLDSKISELMAFRTTTIKELNEEGVPAKKEVKLSAVISEIREVVTKKTGAHMAFAKVEDETGLVNVVIFPKLYEQHKGELLIGNPFLISGKADSRDDEMSIIIESFDTLESLRDKDGEVKISIPENTSKETLQSLKEILLENPGNKTVMLVFQGKTPKTIKATIKIHWDEALAQKIGALLAQNTEDNVQ